MEVCVHPQVNKSRRFKRVSFCSNARRTKLTLIYLPDLFTARKQVLAKTTVN